MRPPPAKKKPGGLKNWQPADTYHFADFGSGEAERIRALASKYPKKRFLAVDPAFEKTERIGNLDLVKANANKVLQLLPDGSIHIANADYFLNEISKEHAKEFLQLLRNKLKAQGRFYVSHRNEATIYVRNLVAGHGFTLSKSRSMEKLKLPMTTSARLDLAAQQGLENLNRGIPAPLPTQLPKTRLLEYLKNPQMCAPMRFVAHPKK